MFIRKIQMHILVFSILFSCISGGVLAQKGLTIRFEHTAGTEKLNLDSGLYTNDLEQMYSVTKFKYYIGHFQLNKADGKSFDSDELFLVNEEDEGSKQIILRDIPPGDYTSIQFTLGVDSILNCSGLQSGSLDPVNGMFWAWNTGYIFMKLEGKSSASRSPGTIYEFHVGGYKAPANCIRRVMLPFDRTGQQKSMEVRSEIVLKADVMEMFRTPFTIDLSQLSTVTDFRNAEKMADNYSDMFSVLEAH